MDNTLEYNYFNMKTLTKWFFQLTNNNWKEDLANAKRTTQMIVESTYGRTNHFYDMNGETIRGWQSPVYHSVGRHPLVEYYNKQH